VDKSIKHGSGGDNSLSILPKRALVAYLYFTSVRQYEGGLCVYFHCSSISLYSARACFMPGGRYTDYVFVRGLGRLFCLSVVLVGLVCVMLIYERCTLPFRSL
jgi:hypothetical protein